MRSLVILLCSFIQMYATIIDLTIVDSESKKTIPARVLIKSLSGQSFVADNAVTLKIANEEWFMSPGESTLHVTTDTVCLRVERGKEYYRIKKIIDFKGKETEEIRIELKRWINMKQKGYLSSENHLHLNASEATAMCAAEDLDFGSSLQWWNRPRFAVPDGEGNTRILNFASEQKELTVYDVEVEEAWGALYIINMTQPFPMLNDPHMPNIIAAKYSRQNGALNCYQAGWSREVLIDALLGYVDIINVCNNNFHMHRYQPRSLYSNLLNVEGLPEYPDTPQGMMQMNTDTYYRLLNCGLKLAAGAGSASGVKEVPAGYNRAYVRSGATQGLQGFLKAWKEGKNFVTNGPMLFIKTSEGLYPGDSLHIASSKNLKLYISAISDSPLKKVEIIVNGQVVKSFSCKDRKQYSDSLYITIDQSSWIAARCSDSDTLLSDQELEKYRSPRVSLYQDPCRLRYAHSSPIYVYRDKKNIAIRHSILEGLRMVKAFKKFAKKNATAQYLQEIMAASDKAEDILQQKLSSL